MGNLESVPRDELLAELRGGKRALKKLRRQKAAAKRAEPHRLESPRAKPAPTPPAPSPSPAQPLVDLTKVPTGTGGALLNRRAKAAVRAAYQERQAAKAAQRRERSDSPSRAVPRRGVKWWRPYEATADDD